MLLITILVLEQYSSGSGKDFELSIVFVSNCALIKLEVNLAFDRVV